MKIIMLMVSTVDGKTTKGNNPEIYHWTSKEDQDHFFQTLEEHNLLLMGRKTYEAARPVMKLTPDRLRIVLTTNPQDFKKEEIQNQLEFTNESPKALIQQLESRGYTKALLLGGGKTNKTFLEENLVDEVWVTMEPRLFGEGNVVVDGLVDVKLELISSKQLNKNGTLLLTYNVLKSS